MHVVLLNLVDPAHASDHLEGHKAWLKEAFDSGEVHYVGGRAAGGGAVLLASGLTTDDLRHRLRADPFVSEGVVEAEVVELDTTMSDPRLSFMVEFAGERLGFQRTGTADQSGTTTSRPRAH